MGSRMRMIYPLPKGRAPQNEDRVTFHKSKEFKLKDFVREKAEIKQTPCLFEMSLVFSCLKESNFNESICVDEVQNFQSCYQKSLIAAEEIRKRRKDPSKLITSEKLLADEINIMFRKFKK